MPVLNVGDVFQFKLGKTVTDKQNKNWTKPGALRVTNIKDDEFYFCTPYLGGGEYIFTKKDHLGDNFEKISILNPDWLEADTVPVKSAKSAKSAKGKLKRKERRVRKQSKKRPSKKRSSKKRSSKKKKTRGKRK